MYTYSCTLGRYKYNFVEKYKTALIFTKQNLQFAGTSTEIRWLLSLRQEV
jgi:hypothetical protein